MSMQKSQLDTWISLKQKENIDVFHYIGDSSDTYNDDKTIYLNTPDMIQNVSLKTLLAFKYVLENGFNFTHIYRTNSSSYVNLELLNKYIKDKPNTNFLAGPSGFDTNFKVKFVSGSGFVISKDLVQLLINNLEKINIHTLDDVSISEFLVAKNKIQIHDIIRTDAYNYDMLNTINKTNVNNAFHFRLKSGNGDRTFDINAMRYIHNLITV
jgi:hypothetical protein